ncbi:MAG: nucleotidyltransferase domain-containing protein [Nocardioides sp.]
MTDGVRALPDPLDTARRLVTERFPDAKAAWLSGSVVSGRATSTSDLDVVVVTDEVEVHRESVVYDGWPVELFVHTADSVRAFVTQDRLRRRPTMARLVADSVSLMGGAGAAIDDLEAECRAAVAAGPEPLDEGQLEALRYGLTDLLDDLAGGGPPEEKAAVAVAVWQATVELRLVVGDRWGVPASGWFESWRSTTARLAPTTPHGSTGRW